VKQLKVLESLKSTIPGPNIIFAISIRDNIAYWKEGATETDGLKTVEGHCAIDAYRR
jgi:hypothetical protein